MVQIVQKVITVTLNRDDQPEIVVREEVTHVGLSCTEE
jgi:hypothetical protein